MKNKKLILLFLILISVPSFVTAQVSQQWMASYDGPAHSYDITQYIDLDPAGNIFTAGTSTNPTTGPDMLICKFSSDGTFLWSRTHTAPGNRNDNSSGLKADPYGNVYLLGEIYTGGGNSELTLIKYNAAGDVIWLKQYTGGMSGYHSPKDMDIDDMGNVYVTGSSNGPHGYSDLVLIKYDTAGTQIFAKYIQSLGQLSMGSSITVDGSGSNIYVAGSYYYDLTWNRDFYTVKFNAAGDTVWTRRESGDIVGDHYATEVITDNAGNVIVSGNTQNISGRDDITVVKYNSAGTRQWKTVNNLSGQRDHIFNIVCDAAGNIYGGCKKGHSVANDFAVQKYNPAGVIEWTKVYDGGGNDALTDMTVDNSGYVYVSGMTMVSGQDANSIILKYNSAGDILWQQQYNNAIVNLGDQARDMVLDNAGNVIITGFTNNTNTATDALVIKYSQSGVTGVQNNNTIPEKFELSQNFPNPFNPATNIKFSIPENGNVTMKVFDAQGKEVAVLVNEFKSASSYSIDFNASHLSSGVYFYRIQTSEFTEVRKMVLVK